MISLLSRTISRKARQPKSTIAFYHVETRKRLYSVLRKAVTHVVVWATPSAIVRRARMARVGRHACDWVATSLVSTRNSKMGHVTAHIPVSLR